MSKDDILLKWLNDGLSSAEAQKFRQEDDYVLCQAIIEHAKSFKASNFSEVDDFETFTSNYSATRSRTKRHNLMPALLRIASVLVIAFGIFFVFFYNSNTEISTLVAETSSIQLPDQSTVTLNSASHIEYQEKNWDTNRVLHLEGEAYFQVKSGSTFTVNTTEGTVTVIGTSFNVKQREHVFEVQCFEGVVSVSSGQETKQLEAGDTFRRVNGNLTQDETSFTEPQWTKGKSYFKALSFKAVIAELERQFDVTVKLEKVDGERLFTGSFSHKNLENALLSITKPMGLNFKVNASNQVIIYGNKN